MYFTFDLKINDKKAIIQYTHDFYTWTHDFYRLAVLLKL